MFFLWRFRKIYTNKHLCKYVILSINCSILWILTINTNKLNRTKLKTFNVFSYFYLPIFFFCRLNSHLKIMCPSNYIFNCFNRGIKSWWNEDTISFLIIIKYVVCWPENYLECTKKRKKKEAGFMMLVQLLKTNEYDIKMT